MQTNQAKTKQTQNSYYEQNMTATQKIDAAPKIKYLLHIFWFRTGFGFLCKCKSL